ncbi:hypothetical protein F4782DRAFT_502172 [Xylaria castorea]|nr:hypothetical protein F4782DRAFT_502172 [Xylaria castorea]
MVSGHHSLPTCRHQATPGRSLFPVIFIAIEFRSVIVLLSLFQNLELALHSSYGKFWPAVQAASPFEYTIIIISIKRSTEKPT